MWKLYDYVSKKKVNEIAVWTKGLQKPQRKKLAFKLDILAKAGPELPPGLLVKTEVAYILKLKVQGNPKLRPMLCSGPLRVRDSEAKEETDEQGFTILVGAKEISWGFEPESADIEASHRRIEVVNDPSNRRCTHERIN